MPGYPCGCKCCLTLGAIPSSITLLHGTSFSNEVPLAVGPWSKVGDSSSCVFKATGTFSSEIAGLSKVQVCKKVGHADMVFECDTKRWTWDLADFPMGTTAVVNMKVAGTTRTKQTVRQHYLLEYSESHPTFEIYLSKQLVMCTDDSEPICQWIISFRLVGEANKSQLDYYFASAGYSTEITRTPDPVIGLCASVFAPGTPSHEYTENFLEPACPFMNPYDLPANDIVRSVKATDIIGDHLFSPGASSGCYNPNLPVDDDIEEFTLGTMPCEPFGSNPCPITFPAPSNTVGKTRRPSGEYWWTVNALAISRSFTDGVSDCSIGGNPRYPNAVYNATAPTSTNFVSETLNCDQLLSSVEVTRIPFKLRIA